eukprot:CAMPEP_0175033728 /NCGR_PEP_ID=MMETSP0005-20121125/22187_1 /TAXON_ID=420556 /ORGANISM="Ochromonas sp., Strain CCMP1393" /LENGTH=415 /DNA_ID=CAMNT_0016294431 /DNA_START=505 /DNA_END=1753 /DNA_ORIENTATION=+
MSDTGGGHRASAQALDQALQEQHPGKIDVNIMDIWTDHAPFPYNRFVPMYRYLAKHPILWRGMYAYGKFPPTKLFQEVDSRRVCYKRFKRAIEDADPDFVVSVHPLCQLIPISIVQEMNRKRSPEKPRIPFVTIVTDLGSAHSTWFDRRADAVFVPSTEVRDIARRCGYPASKILMKGLPIRPSFWKESQPKDAVRKTLGMADHMKTVLLMGGGDGVGGLGNIAAEVTNKLKKLDLKSRLIVICGHNAKMTQQLTQKLRPDPDHVDVMVKGFVDNIDEYMSASDCLITKAGPGTIAESMIRGLPLIISSYLPGQVLITSEYIHLKYIRLHASRIQLKLSLLTYYIHLEEYGNVPFVVKGGFGVYTGNNPKKIASTVSDLVSNDTRLREMSEHAKILSHPEATKAIATDIAGVLLQ